MSVPTLIACSMFMLVVLAAMAVAFLHMRALSRYNNSVPEMKKTVATLNAAILQASVTLQDFKNERDNAVSKRKSAGRNEPPPVPARSGRQSLAALVGRVAAQQDHT